MVKLFVEGGGDAASLKTACRRAFSSFITKTGISKRPRIVACGSREDAFRSYCTAIRNNEEAFLLVDSECAVSASHQNGASDQWTPWEHLRSRDNWEMPGGGKQTDCHLMVQVMESWFLADRTTLSHFFGQGFQLTALPALQTAVESISKQQVYAALEKATRSCRPKSSYAKGEHSFTLLEIIDSNKVLQASPWAKRFVDELCKKMT